MAVAAVGNQHEQPGIVTRTILSRRHLTIKVATLLALLGLTSCLLTSGCQSETNYPSNIVFPSRTDRLVLKIPETTPRGPGDPGRLEAEIAELDTIGGKTAEPLALPASTRATLDQFLLETFGTPGQPKVEVGDEQALQSRLMKLGLDGESLSSGSKLFRTHCQGCHGLSGDGRGPAGLFLNPYPRDFRRGAFKFTSTGANGKPSRSDLVRTISEGLTKGTAMPSFARLTETERDLLAGYVTFLAIRGQVEFEVYQAIISGPLRHDVSECGHDQLGRVLTEWEQSSQSAAVPAAPDDGDYKSPTHQAAVRRGYELFTAKSVTECLKCHGDFGRKPVLRYDLWGTIARPGNFTEPSLKGGARPEDVYARIRWGIAPVGMPAHPTLTDRQVWDLVRFVRAIPYPRELPEEIRSQVYPSP